VDSASGLHQRHSPYYIRRVRGDIKDPLTKFFIEKGVSYEPCVMKPDTTVVFSFPIRAPEGSPTRDDVTAVQHLALWLTYQRHWCEHKPSVTINVLEKEWPEVGAWVWNHFDEISGVSFLPMDGGSYRQAPYEAITEEQYNEMLAASVKSVNWDDMIEEEDTPKGSQTLACVGNVCEML
jgi:ribonucleoside-diphosphate reductase alpha chain